MKKISSKFNCIYLIIVAVFLFFSCFFPNNFNIIKTITLGMLSLISILIIYFNKISIKKSYLYVLFCFLIYALFSLWLTIKNGYAIDFKLVEIWLVRPIILLIITVPLSLEENKEFLYKSVIILSKLLVIYDLLFMLNVLIFKTDFVLFSNLFSQSGPIILDSTFITIRMENFTSLMFLLPLLNWTLISKFISKKASLFDLLVFISGLLVTLLSGRRAFQIIVLLSLIVTILISLNGRFKEVNMFIKRNLRSLFLIVLLAGCLFYLNVFGIRDLLSSVASTIIDAFDVTSHSGEIRANQLVYLTKEFFVNPIFGSGLGAYVTDFVRHGVYMWSYEFFYNALLMQIGVVGVISLATIVMKILHNISVFSRNMSKPFLVGAICFFIAAFSNPMFTSPWIWFILIGLSHESLS